RGLPGKANAPRLAKVAQPPLACHQVERTPPSPPRMKTWGRPSALGAIAGSEAKLPPRLANACQLPWAVFCQTCQSALSTPRANTSTWPSELHVIAAGLPARLPPSEPQLLQPVEVPGCSKMCCSEPSALRAKTSRTPLVLSAV